MFIPGRAGQIRLRVLAPEQAANGIYLHLHGGGWVLGERDLQDPLLWDLAQATGLCVVSAGHRLAPEHPYPAAPGDCEDTALWLLEHGPARFAAPPVFAIGGESAGAHLSVVTVLRLRDRHQITGAFRAANLVYGCYDLSMTPSQRLWGQRRLPLTTSGLRWFAEQYTPGLTGEQRQAPDVSPLYADLRGLPPALFSVGALDPLLDDSLFLSARWRAAGNDTELVIYPEAPHGFIRFPVTAARICNAAQHTFLRSQVTTAPMGDSMGAGHQAGPLSCSARQRDAPGDIRARKGGRQCLSTSESTCTASAPRWRSSTVKARCCRTATCRTGPSRSWA